jgi:hypothetical protein
MSEQGRMETGGNGAEPGGQGPTHQRPECVVQLVMPAGGGELGIVVLGPSPDGTRGPLRPAELGDLIAIAGRFHGWAQAQESARATIRALQEGNREKRRGLHLPWR